jgi:hypothetical protein
MGKGDQCIRQDINGHPGRERYWPLLSGERSKKIWPLGDLAILPKGPEEKMSEIILSWGKDNVNHVYAVSTP